MSTRLAALALCLSLGLALLAAPLPARAQDDLQANKDLVRRFYRAILTNDQETLPRLFAQGYQVEEVGPPSAMGGASSRSQISPDFRVRASHLHQAFGSLSLSISDLIAEGDQVVARVTITGVHRGEFMGVVATGRRVSLNAMVIFQIKDGRIAKTTELLDMLGAMRQIGYIKLD